MARRVTPLDQDHIEPHMCSMDLRLYILSHLPFFQGLSADQIREINPQFVDRGYQSGVIIYTEGDPASRLYVVADGIVKLTQMSQSGKEVMLDVLKSGEFFGSLTHSARDVYTQTAYAQTPVCALSIEGRQFRQILKDHSQIALHVMDIMTERLRESQEMVRLISTAPVEQRIAFVLLKLADKLGEKDATGLLIQMPLSREDIANLTALTTETVSRVMSQFQKENLIQSGRQWVAISAKEELKNIAKIA